jgi:hypothetical protein
MTSQINLIYKIVACKSILLISLFLSAPNALAQSGGDSVSATSDDGAATYTASQTVNAEDGYALSELASRVSDPDGWVTGSQVYTYNVYDADTDTTDARVTLGAAASNSCIGGSNDECGAQISMRQTSVGGVNNGSTINMSAAKVRINGNVSLGNIGDNGSFVSDLAAYVTTNRATAQTNGIDIATNVAGVTTNADGVAANVATLTVHEGLVTQNIADIATNAATLTVHEGLVTQNIADIATNAATLTVHEGLVTQNIADIATNAATLTVHTTAIGNLQSSFTNFQTEAMDNFARMGSDMHRGLAEVTALSNVAYADKGWRASIGYGDYESKSAAAVGISYAGEKFKFKVSRSGKATGAGLAFDF